MDAHFYSGKYDNATRSKLKRRHRGAGKKDYDLPCRTVKYTLPPGKILTILSV